MKLDERIKGMNVDRRVQVQKRKKRRREGRKGGKKTDSRTEPWDIIKIGHKEEIEPEIEHWREAVSESRETTPQPPTQSVIS